MQLYGQTGGSPFAIVDTNGRLYVNSQVSGVIHDWTTQLIQRMDYEDKMQPVYIGLAPPGTNTGSANWQIRKNEFSGTHPELVVGVLFGSGNTNFDKVWSDRSGTNAAYS